MKVTVGVFFGGRSVEHEISVISALQSINAFDNTRYRVVPIYITKSGEWYSGETLLEVDNYKNTDTLLSASHKVFMTPDLNDFNLYQSKKGLFGGIKVYDILDVVIPILHGTYGEDGALQGFFELKGLPYAGCDVLSSAVGMDKIIMKKILRESQIPVVDYYWFTDKQWHSEQDEILAIIEKIGYPLIVKPANLGSSVGISKAGNKEELFEAIDLAGSFSQRILVEKMILQLKEINCSVLGDAETAIPSVCEEPLRSGEILSYTDKYISKGGPSKGMSSTQRKIPADLPDELNDAIRETAVKTFKTLGSSGVSRIDFLVDEATDKFYVNEINTIPGSLSFYLWEATDKSFTQLMDDLIQLALKRQREQSHLLKSYDENIFQMSGGSIKLGTKS